MNRQIPTIGQPTVDPTKATFKQCKCGSDYFDLAYKIGVVSRMAPGNNTGQDVMVKFETFICRWCGDEYGKSEGKTKGAG